MHAALAQLRVRPRLMVAVGLGLAVALLLPGPLHATTRGLLGWNAAVWLYLLLLARMMHRADEGHLRRSAVQQADGAPVVLLLAITAALASLAAIALELSHARGSSGPGWQDMVLAVGTIAGSWILLPLEFALAYASRFYGAAQANSGLCFPSDEDGKPEQEPDYIDFLYFAFTIAATSQTSDVAVTKRSMRRLVLLHSVLSFAFNTVLLALTINIVAGSL
nr:DUF1345 domain-containing protein [uncultured Roseateles sp.]